MNIKCTDGTAIISPHVLRLKLTLADSEVEPRPGLIFLALPPLTPVGGC